MALYYIDEDVSKNENGNHVLHKKDCVWMPNFPTFIGIFDDGKKAMKRAIEKGYESVECCSACCPEICEEQAD